MKRFFTIVTALIITILSFAQSTTKYAPEVFALESGRGKLAEVYFGASSQNMVVSLLAKLNYN